MVEPHSMRDSARRARIDISFDGCAGVFNPASGAHAAIICGGYGYDDLCTYQNLAGLADDLAAAGIPTLRFDYHGTGNSLGDENDPDRIGTWTGNIAAAADWLREHAGARSITLVGYRLGALLAALALPKVPQAQSLVLVAPAISGRAYVREMQLQSQLYPAADDASVGADGGVSAAGFRLSSETAAAVKAINLAKLPLGNVRDVALFADGIGRESPLVVALEAQGARVAIEGFAALAELTVDPIRSLSVVSPFAGVVEHLRQRAVVSDPVQHLNVPLAVLHGSKFDELRLRIPGERELFAVHCRPHDEALQSPTVLLVNGGANRNIGWGRYNVRLARSLAAQGIASLRVDLAGLGESPVPSAVDQVYLYDQRFQADVARAADWLEQQGVSSIVGFGACSGAQTLFHASIDDPRFTAIVMVNLLRFEMAASEARRVGGAQAYRSTANYLQRLGDPAAWRSLLRGGGRKAIGLAREYGRRGRLVMLSRAGAVLARATGIDRLYAPIARKFARFLRRGGRMLVIYGATDDGLAELAVQVGPEASRVRDIGDLQLVLLEESDHNLTSRSSQDRMIQAVGLFIGSDENGGTEAPPSRNVREPVGSD